jgi:transcriptional regulator with XRE-family HTH domain
MTKTLGERIRELREERDISVREFARVLGGVTAAHISDIELGRRYPSDALLGKIAAALGVELAELQRYDRRAPVDDLKRRAEADPTYGFALRKLVEHDISAEELLRLIREMAEEGRDDTP